MPDDVSPAFAVGSAMKCSVCGGDFNPTELHSCTPRPGAMWHIGPPVDWTTERPAPQGEWVKHWDAYANAVKPKLARGLIEYGDASFDLPLEKLIDELKQECLDLAGWGMILWVKLSRIEQAIKGSQSPDKEQGS